MIGFKDFVTEDVDKALKDKSEKSGVSMSVLRQVYRRGVAAWNSGHRPGTTPQQWGLARVNSYITKGKTYHTADKDLREDARAEKETYHRGVADSTAKARVAHWKKMDKLSDRDPRAYEPAPGDARAKTKPSKYTKAYHDKYGDGIDEATYQGRKVTLNKPMPGDVKKSKVYVDPDGDGKAKKVEFGDPNMTIKKHIPARRKSFRARHNCDDPGPKDKARYWSCKAW